MNKENKLAAMTSHT